MIWKKILKDKPLFVQKKTNTGELLRLKIIKFVAEYCLQLNLNLKSNNKFRLNKLHLFLEPEKIPDLQTAIEKEFKKDICDWVMFISEKCLGMKDEYYVDEKIYFRINYPFDYAIKSKSKDPKHPLHKYNKGLPRAAWVHGPHIDTWYGHSFKAINFWWNVAGVTNENSMTLHLKKDTSDLLYDEFMYLDSSIKPPPFTRIDLKEGELLLFNSEQLHSTRLNSSNNTRFVITTRVVQDQPSFNKSINHHHYLKWMSSKNLKLGDFSTKEYKNFITKTVSVKKLNRLRTIPFLKINANFYEQKYFDNPQIKKNSIIKINFKDRSVILVNLNNKYFAYSNKCPHLGVDLENAFLIDNKIKCPAHGLEFNSKDGFSGCKLKLKTFKVKYSKNKSMLSIL